MKRWLSAVLLLALAVTAFAAPPDPSGYSTFKGEPFFLLSDATYGSTEQARVRLEVPGRDMGRANLEAYSGADIVLYRVPAPMDFLKKQRNLHRIHVEGNYQGEGLANTLSFLWDSWWKQSRLAWRRIFSKDARRAVTGEQPQLATNKAIYRPTVFSNHPQYKPLKGFEMVDSFRYPLWQAEPIAPPKGVKLDGSSSEFITQGAGNVMIPIGHRKPGLYLVEAIIGEHRATTLVFVSDAMAVTKISSNQMLVWTARRDNGAVVPNVKFAWTDGTGVLQSGVTAANGIATVDRASPEHSYLLGEDPAGGVFVSENFYYESEIYNTKLYAVTDRPLYRPGDEVNVKFLGREFTSARNSQAAAAAPLGLTVFDPNGTPLLTQTLQLSGETGADTRFQLPAQASAGGYELRFTYKDNVYGAAFRVAEYIKPHFEINVQPSKPEFKTGEAVTGAIELRYPDGKPVKDAAVSLTLRSQQNTMVDGELRYAGLFPVQLKTEELKTDGSGNVKFSLPPAADPSRYILTLLATDGAAYRVKSTRELLIERSLASYHLTAARQFSDPGQSVHFDLVADSASTSAARPVRWEMVQLETQTKTNGAFSPAAKGWDVAFPASGSYQLSLRDERGNLLAATSHWVSGDGVKSTPGTIEIVLDKQRYQPGETAEALITFSDQVDQALFTLERDKVEQAGLMAGGADWYKAQRIAPRQWRVRIPVKEEHGPNVTFSVAYVRNGDFVFENAGLQVIEPRIALQFRTDKEVYQPGEKVTLDVNATLDGKPVSTLVALGVVDEMIYVLQPEIAPDIGDFFYHPRRNNVRTTASLSFISYDMAQGRSSGTPARHNYNERGVKVLERPRRDNVDTAYWAPSLQLGADGHARISFTMPDALTRWRITGRAMDTAGRVGQRTGYVRSDKAFYAKWTAPNWMRSGDAPSASVAVFNQTSTEQALEVALSGGAQPTLVKLSAKPGVNYLAFPLAANPGVLHLQVRQAGKVVDALDTPIDTLPVNWLNARSLTLPVAGPATALKLPVDARNIRVSFADTANSHFARIADDLMDYPYGCVEQTASRLIPLTLAIDSLPASAGGANDLVRDRLQAMLTAQRLRLVSMAGPKAVFGWWGNATDGDALMTAYAYYADWHAARVLHITLPPEHWANLLQVYSTQGLKLPPAERGLILWMANAMGLPTETLAAGLVDDMGTATLGGTPRQAVTDSLLLNASTVRDGQAMGLGLVALVARQNKVALPPKLQEQVTAAWAVLRGTPAPAAQALLMLAGELPATQADAILASTSAEQPTFDRAMTLLWVRASLGGAAPGKQPDVALAGTWQKLTSRSGQPVWRWPGATLPDQLQLADGTAAPARTVAVVQYDSRDPHVNALPVTINRRILRMKPGAKGYSTEPVKAGEALSTTELYLDEITLTPAAGASHRFGLLEVALPPGGVVEASTWGITLDGAKPAPLERARHTERRDGYAVPIDTLDAPLTVRHLLRFAQKGQYVLPPARFQRMYQPDAKAFEGGGKTTRTLQVE